MQYIWEVDLDADAYLAVQQLDLRYFQSRFDGRPLRESWETPPYELLGRSKKVADFTSWQIGSWAFLISERARALIEPLSGDDVEYLPFDRLKRVDIFAVNVLREEDLMRPGHSVNELSGMMAWRTDLPKSLPLIFKVKGARRTYASSALGHLAVSHGLTGLRLADPAKDRSKQIINREQINEFPGL